MGDPHTLSVLVENKPGVLTRVAALFARRSFNITSLTVGETEHPTISRMTIIVAADEIPLEQVTKQLNKLVNVIKVVELEPNDSIERRLMLIKVRGDESRRTGVLQVVDLFRAHVVDVNVETLVIECIGSQQKLDALLASLEPYGIKEIVQSGAVGIGRSPRSITEQLKEK